MRNGYQLMMLIRWRKIYDPLRNRTRMQLDDRLNAYGALHEHLREQRAKRKIIVPTGIILP